MEELKTLLGLAPDAADEQVVAAAKAMKDRLDQTEAAARDAEAEKFAAENSAAFDHDALKDAYLKAPEVAKKLVANRKAPPAPAKAPALPDFTRASTPPALNSKAPAARPATPADAYKAYVAMAEGPEKDAFLAANAQAISDGHEAVVLNSKNH